MHKSHHLKSLTLVLSSFFNSIYFTFVFQVIAQRLSEEEIAGLKEMFKMIDTDNSGQITYDELKVGLKKFGADLDESEFRALMQAVSFISVINIMLFIFHEILNFRVLSIPISET